MFTGCLFDARCPSVVRGDPFDVLEHTSSIDSQSRRGRSIKKNQKEWSRQEAPPDIDRLVKPIPGEYTTADMYFRKFLVTQMQNKDEKIVTVSLPTRHTRTYLRFLLVERKPFLRRISAEATTTTTATSTTTSAASSSASLHHLALIFVGERGCELTFIHLFLASLWRMKSACRVLP
jgi:hypothetical protein